MSAVREPLAPTPGSTNSHLQGNLAYGYGAVMSPRRPASVRMLGTALIAAALAAGACSPGPQPVTEPTPPPTTTPTLRPTPPATASPTVAPTTTADVPDLDAVLTHWQSTWATAGDPTAGPLPATVTADAAATLTSFLRGGDAPPVRTFVHAAVAEPLDDDPEATVVVVDCLLATPPIGETAAAWFRGTYLADGTLTAVEAVALGGCVPAEIAAAAIASYEDHWDAAVGYWAPADPSSPRIAETLTGDRLDRVQALVTEHAAAGIELRGRPTTHPEIVEYRSPIELVILDCQEVDPATGLFEAATGRRLPDIAPVAPGQRDVRSAVMRFLDGRWKVAERQGETDVDCQFAPTASGIPVA